jgi:hypothetical protein
MNPRMRRIRSVRCARAASGHAAALPTSVINARRFSRSPRRRGQGRIAAWHNVTAPAIKNGHDSWKQDGGDHGMAFARQMDKVDGIITQRDLVIVDDHLNPASPQPSLHLRNVGGPLLLGAEETPIVAARLQDRDVCSVRHILVDAAKHHRRSVKRHSGIGDLSIDAFASEEGLQLRGVCASVANVPAMGVAGADRDNP